MHAELTRGDSTNSMITKQINNMGGLNSRQPSTDHELPGQNNSGLPRSRTGSELKSDTIAGSGMGQGTPNMSYSQLPQLKQLSSQSSDTASPRAHCSASSSEECLHCTLTPASPPSVTSGQYILGKLSEEAKADLIAQLASDPQAMLLMREVVSKGEAKSLNIRNKFTGMDEIQKQNTLRHCDELLSPLIHFKSQDPSKTFYQRRTSTTSTQTDEEMSSFSLKQAAAIGSLASSREAGYDSIPTSFTVQGERERCLIFCLEYMSNELYM